MFCRDIQGNLAKIHILRNTRRCSDAIGTQNILYQHGRKVVCRHLICAKIAGSINEYLVDAVWIDIVHRHILEVGCHDFCATLTVQSHPGRCCNIINGQVWIFLQLGIIIRRSGKVSAMNCSFSFSVCKFNLLDCFKQPCSARYAMCLQARRHSQTDRFLSF